MKTSFIRQQLERHLKSWVNQQTTKPSVAWQNAPFTPPSSGIWLQATVLPADTVSGSLAATEWKGAFRVNVFGPAGTGSNAVESVAQAIAQHFGAGTDLAGVRVLRPPSVGRGNNDDSFFMVPVSIRYRLDAQ